MTLEVTGQVGGGWYTGTGVEILNQLIEEVEKDLSISKFYAPAIAL